MRDTAFFTRLGEHTDVLGESVLWCEREQALYWVDIYGPLIRRWEFAGGAVTSWTMPSFPGSIALREGGGLLVALRDSLAIFDPASGGLREIARLPQTHPGLRSNDGRTDRQGRFWVSTMNDVSQAAEGALYRVGPAHDCVQVASDLAIPNSLSWSPDGRTMYFTDTPTKRIDGYAFDPGSGEPTRPHPFARTEPPGGPDGSTVDAEGYLWNAEYGGGRLTRYAPDGSVDRHVPLPVQNPTCCAFGGPRLDILFVTTASQQMSPEELAHQPLAGAVLALETPFRGLSEPRYID